MESEDGKSDSQYSGLRAAAGVGEFSSPVGKQLAPA